MRPLRLEIQAFGSYGGNRSFDLARLGGHGVFSITGPTGAGKSTIFDAIVYALYGELPGFRTQSHIRSQFADPSTTTSVTLEFAADGREWMLCRQPAQEIPRKRGGGTRTQAASVVLRELNTDRGGWTRKNEVESRVIELVGFNRDQFEQVVLIPQGRFEQVLKADTNQRAALLGRLFPVDLYRRVTELLRQRSTEARAAYDAVVESRSRLDDRMEADLAAATATLDDVERGDASDTGTAERPAHAPRPTPVGRSIASLIAEGDDAEVDDEWESDEADATALGDSEGASMSSADAEAEEGTGPESDGEPEGSLDPEARLATLHIRAARLDDRAARARAEHEAARSARQAAEDAVVAWVRWQEDLVAVQGHAGEEDEDRAATAQLDRVREVVLLETALTGWRAQSQALRSAMTERDLVLSTLAAHGDGAPDVLPEDPNDVAALAMRLAADADVLDRAESERLAITDEEARIATGVIALTERAEDLQKRVHDLGRDRAALISATEAAAELTERALGLADAQEGVRQADMALAAAQARAAAEDEVARLTSRANEAGATQEQAAIALADVAGRWRAGLAGRLAQGLVPDVPCPTCGSIDHPQPAPIEVGAPSDAELDEAEARSAAATDAASALRDSLSLAKGQLSGLPESSGVEEAQSALTAARSRCHELEEVASQATTLATEVSQARERLERAEELLAEERSRLDADLAASAATRQSWNDRRQRFLDGGGTMESTSERASHLRSRAEGLRRLAEVLVAYRTAYDTRATHLSALEATMTQLEVTDPDALMQWSWSPSAVSDEEQRLAARLDARRAVARRLEEYERAKHPTERPDPEPLVVIEQAARTAMDYLVGRSASVHERLDSAEATVAELAGTATALDAARRAKEEAETVATVCDGGTGGPTDGRRSLEHWVLAVYLRRVLTQANQRLNHMSHGRYALVVSDAPEDRRKSFGLDLAVADAETGLTRPASTLSGGETFLAALALALGLADVVASGSNTTIGALFVDEGFGSLDPEALDSVVDVLRSLQDGGRIVGVISHVQGVKDALPNGIAVETTSAGSIATIRYPDA